MDSSNSYLYQACVVVLPLEVKSCDIQIFFRPSKILASSNFQFCYRSSIHFSVALDMAGNLFHTINYSLLFPRQITARDILPGGAKTLASLPAQVILEICKSLEPRDLLSLSRVGRAFRARIASPEFNRVWLVVLETVPGLPDWHPSHDMTIAQFASLVFDDWCMSCGTDGKGVHFFSLRLRLCENCQIIKLVRGSVLKQRYQKRNDVPPIFKVLPSTSDYKESGESDFFYKPAVARVKRIYSKLSEDARQQFILTETARASYMMDRGFELLVWKRKLQEKQLIQAGNDSILSRYDQIIKRGEQEWDWKPQYFPVPRDSDYYPEWQKLLCDTTAYNENEWQIIRSKLKNIYDLIQRRRSIEVFTRSILESYLKHRSRLPEPHRSLSLTWQQVYHQMMKSFPRAENHSAHFQSSLDTSLKHARQLVADVSVRITISLIYFDSKPGGTDRMLFATLVEWGIIPIICRCHLCIQRDERFIRGYASFLSHLLVEVHPIVTDWIHVPREQVKMMDFSRILKVASEVLEILGFDQISSTLVFNLRLMCQCGHPSYQGPLTFGQLIDHICTERAWFDRITRNLKPEEISTASSKLIDDHSSQILRTKIQLFDTRHHRTNFIVDPPTGGPLDFPCCVHCYRLAGQLVPVSFSEAYYHMKKHRQAIALDCDRALGRVLIGNRPIESRRPLDDFTMRFNRNMLS